MTTVILRNATLIGLTAILMWSLLAALTLATGAVPPFQLLAMTFAIGALTGFIGIVVRTGSAEMPRPPLTAMLIGVGGLFGYHALYFLALRAAPPAEAGLLNYLWPLLIVLLSSLLPGERLRRHHVIGALLGLAGTAVLLWGNLSSEFTASQIAGLTAAFAAAFVWAGYSVVSRHFRNVSTDAVAVYCATTAACAFIVSRATETWAWPDGAGAWLAVIALGIGPVGAAFFAWDIGMKHGDIRVLGAASYATPLLSTGCLIASGYAQLNASLGLAAILIAAGGLVAAKDMISRNS